MKNKIKILSILFLILSLVACQKENSKFGVSLEKYNDIEFIYLENDNVGKRDLDDEKKEKISKLIEALNEDDFEKVEFEQLIGEGPKIKFNDFIFEILDKKIIIDTNNGDVMQYNPKQQIKELNELDELLHVELDSDY